MSAEELGKAKARLGTIAVVGDHDYWAGTGNVKAALNAEGIPLLQDENKAIQANSSSRNCDNRHHRSVQQVGQSSDS
ncbi:MAG: hypothetical protein U5J63_15935 [Fodinibius sp.]|nr:hypothetical protein [Fodinibius sp.]